MLMILGLLTFLSSSIRRLFYIFDFLFIFLLVSLFYIFCFYYLTCFKSNINYYFCQYYCLCFNRGNFHQKSSAFFYGASCQITYYRALHLHVVHRLTLSLKSFQRNCDIFTLYFDDFGRRRSFLRAPILLLRLHSSASRDKPLYFH